MGRRQSTAGRPANERKAVERDRRRTRVSTSRQNQGRGWRIAAGTRSTATMTTGDWRWTLPRKAADHRRTIQRAAARATVAKTVTPGYMAERRQRVPDRSSGRNGHNARVSFGGVFRRATDKRASSFSFLTNSSLIASAIFVAASIAMPQRPPRGCEPPLDSKHADVGAKMSSTWDIPVQLSKKNARRRHIATKRV